MNWCIEEKGYCSGQTEFLGNKLSIGNGYMGYRGTLEEYGRRELVACTVSEVFDDNGNGWREPINVPNGLFTVPEYRGRMVCVQTTQVQDHVQQLHIDAGRHYRKTNFRTEDGKTLTVEAERFASVSNVHLLVMKYTVSAQADMELTIHTQIDQDIWNINGNHFRDTRILNSGETSGVVCTTIQNQRKVAVAQRVKLLTENMQYRTQDAEILIRVHLKAGQSAAFEKYVAVCKDTDCQDVWADACRNCAEAEALGYDALLVQQKERWAARYENLGIHIKGDEEAEQAIYYSCYLLYCSAPEHTDTVAIPARGLSGQVYKGAMFWDTEIYMLPMFAYCDPKIAKNLMMYRVHNLEGARLKAAEYGYRGAFYPWESQENGLDGCTHYNLTDIFTGRKLRTYFRDKQVHISADVAYGIWKYVTVTQDKSILLEGGAEVILECARFFNSYAYYKKDKGRFELLDVTGADEYHERINNDAYTNYLVWLNAKIALDVMAWMDENHHEEYIHLMDKLNYWDEVKDVREMCERIYRPMPNEDGVIEQFSGYFKEEDITIEELYARIIKPNEYLGSPVGLAVNTQILKQADVVLLLSLLSEQFTDEVKEKNWAYYEPRTEHGSSLSTCIYALLAAKIGKTDWAYQFLMKAAQLDLVGNYKLYLGDLYIGGTHPAANGGTWMVTTQGFGGLEATDDGLVLNPHLPEKWEELAFNFRYGAYSCKARVDHNKIYLCVQADTDKPLSVTVRGNRHECQPNTLKVIHYA